MLGQLLDPVSRCVCTDKDCMVGGRRGQFGEIIEENPHNMQMMAYGDFIVDAASMRGVLPRGPADRVVPTFDTGANLVELHGEPLYSGEILELRLGQSMHRMCLVLYANGYSITPISSGADRSAKTVSGIWSPFSLVQKCQVKTVAPSLWAVFKLTVFRNGSADINTYFTTSGDNAAVERDAWMEQISQAIATVTMSLFPPSEITVQPLPWEPNTITRIMAGYLLQCTLADHVSVIYCELHAYSGRQARFVVYKDEWCEIEVSNKELTEHTVVGTRSGTHCNVFSVDEGHFCARTAREKELWLRAVSNVKVKLMFEAPDPTAEELDIFRAAVREQIDSLNALQVEEDYDLDLGMTSAVPMPRSARVPSSPVKQAPLLLQVRRAPDVAVVRGDIEPFEDPGYLEKSSSGGAAIDRKGSDSKRREHAL